MDYETYELVGGSEAYASKQSSASPFRIMTATTVPLAAAIAVEVTAATVVMNKSNRDNISRGAADVLDSSSTRRRTREIGIGDNGRGAAEVVFGSGPQQGR